MNRGIAIAKEEEQQQEVQDYKDVEARQHSCSRLKMVQQYAIL